MKSKDRRNRKPDFAKVHGQLVNLTNGKIATSKKGKPKVKSDPGEPQSVPEPSLKEYPIPSGIMRFPKK